MFPKIRWRIAVSYLVLVLIVMGSLAAAISRPDCLGDAVCVRRSVTMTAVVMAFLTIFLALIVAERTALPLRQLTHVTRRIAAGELNARILPQTRDEMGDLIRAFNNMMEVLGGQLATVMEQHQQFETVLEIMADGVLITDDLGTVNLINPAATRLLNTTEKAALGRSFAEVVRHHQLINLWQDCRMERREKVEAVEVGRELFVQVAVTPFQEKGARGYLVILQDLTAVHRLQTIRRDFISNISHELRTPLASLRAVVETLQDGALEDPPAAQHFLDRAVQEVDVLTQMVEELLELSRIESGQVPLRLAPTAVSDLLLIPVERLRSQAQRADVELNLDLPSPLPPVLADAERIQQVVTNLLHNAIKFTPSPGKVTIRASGPMTDELDEVVISIQDTGIGIPREDLPRIFERFYKSDRARTRSRGGTGLGLAICRHIVQAHNGRIWVNSKEGKGSTFFFSLPVSNT
ncbi:MAG TPA: ATP-binding protein [Anaerolineae bacterium]